MRAETEPLVETRVLATWSDSGLELTPFDTYDVVLDLRIEHGPVDYWVDDGPHRVEADSTTFLDIPWPDLAGRGDLAEAPAIVSGFLHLTTSEGEDRGVVALERQLWFPSTGALEPQDALAAMISSSVMDGEEPYYVATASPEAILGAAVTR